MPAGLADFFKYNLWANRRLLDACANMTDEQLDAKMIGIYGSIRETLTHMIAAEEGYASRSTFTSPVPSPRLNETGTFPGFAFLRERAERSGKELIAMADQAKLDETLHLDGGTYDADVIIVMLQALNHGIDHRSQICTIMTQQNIEPPNMDAWAYNDALRAAT